MATLRLGSKLDFADFVSSDETEIVDSHDFQGGQWRDLTGLPDFGPKVRKLVIPVDISPAKFLVLTEVDGPSTTQAHKHDEAILRFVLSGEFTLNGKRYESGDWVYVPANVEYTIRTDQGYVTLAGYGTYCNPPEPPPAQA